MGKFIDILNEMASGSAAGAGAIASTPGTIGKPIKRETIFAMSNEQEGNVVTMGGERESKDVMTPQQLTVLRNSMARINKVDPESPTYEKMIKLLDDASDELLKQLAGAEIKFISMLARNRVMRRGIGEGSDRIKNDPCWKGYKRVGEKMKDGKKVPNCVPESISEEDKEDIAEIRRRAGIDEN